jgi:hypothetical protein
MNSTGKALTPLPVKYLESLLKAGIGKGFGEIAIIRIHIRRKSDCRQCICQSC